MTLILKPEDVNSLTWAKIREHYEDLQSELRIKLEGDLDDHDTTRMRGRLFEIKNLLVLGDPAPVIGVDDDADDDDDRLVVI